MGIELKSGYYVIYSDFHDETTYVHWCGTLREAQEQEREFNEIAFGGYLVYVFDAQE